MGHEEHEEHKGRKIRTVVAALCTALLAASSAYAHHSFAAEFSSTDIRTIKGTVVEWQWMNPHAYLYLDVVDKAGNKARWGVQSRNLSILKRQGLSRQTFPAGEVITVELFHHHDLTKNVGFARFITKADGTKFDLIPGGRGGIVPPNP